ncbi:GNAT family N-acetyltransferase [Fimbriimonas ginsengisoli]|uniref:GCN5-like N-acetyltransferase n=1 Tax=Fimbriimonas ginsengisoli Gsoil 348 TaxID=661478 RepID=A0A068NZ75_FIMGI|nr:GNAT family N-acetyltransferase [Fimbriimonas ginsengisoli]AIE88084.1 GCN5-like N-acetyltransferase [Fimbriimonas ginsengisoli Gsoil 348]
MPSIIVRPMQPEDAGGFYDVRALTYNNGDPVPEERRVFKHTRPFAALSDGEVAGAFVTLDLTCTRGKATLRCVGVAGVAVYPHRRKGGIGTTMMKWLIRQLREEGIPVASLYAFREPFYRRAGYEVAGKRLKIVCPTPRFPKVAHDLPIRRLTPADWEQLNPCYEAFAHARSGLSLRTEKLWERVLGENRPLTIYAAGDPVEAYAVVSHNVDFWSTDHISDVAWSTLEGYRALLDTFAGIGINKTALSWFEPSDSPFFAQYLDQGVQVTADRPVMFRVCDVPLALRSLHTEESGEFTIRVVDDVVPENEGPWRVAFRPGEVVVEPADTAELTLDVRPFAQAFLGEPSLADLARLGLVTVGNAAALKAAQRLMPPSPVICADFF